ncbi:hypothetical protein [Desulfosporosinus sp. SB140]|uniref:hypothetical protein n=1 Tax=Desulfosporosinus paludis TaxID=3115649 RepID=UPI00389046A8
MGTLEKLASSYERTPVIRGLIQLIPFGIGSGIDVALVTTIQNIRADRVKTFFDQLEANDAVLNPELLKSEDFLHCYFATVNAALNTKRREKIRMFAKLLSSAVSTSLFNNSDEYEEYLSILDELTFRELVILNILHRHEDATPLIQNENDLQRANRFWEKFIEEIETELRIPRNEINSLLTRLNRTGCYETFTGSYLSYTGGRGKLTPLYFRLESLVDRV